MLPHQLCPGVYHSFFDHACWPPDKRQRIITLRGTSSSSSLIMATSSSPMMATPFRACLTQASCCSLSCSHLCCPLPLTAYFRQPIVGQAHFDNKCENPNSPEGSSAQLLNMACLLIFSSWVRAKWKGSMNEAMPCVLFK